MFSCVGQKYETNEKGTPENENFIAAGVKSLENLFLML